MIDLTPIKVFLTVLGLAISKLPTLAEYKRAYRVLLLNHPDRGGDEEVFKKITEAARHVFQFITKHQEHQTRNESAHNKDLLHAFQESTNVSYNDGNIVFPIEAAQADLWVLCLGKKLGEAVPLNNGSGGSL